MPKSLDQPAAFPAEDKNVTLERITTQTFLHNQSQALHSLAHIAMAACNPNPHARTDRDHLSARITAAARSQDAPDAILTLIPFAKFTTMVAAPPSPLPGTSRTVAGTKAGPTFTDSAWRRHV